MIVGLTNGLNAQIQVINGDTFALVPIAQIDKSYLIYLEFDELKEVYKIDSAYNYNKIIELNKQIGYHNGIIKEKNEIISKLENVKVPKLNGVLGGEFGAAYNVVSKHILSPYIAINGGLIFKRKYIALVKVGFDLNQNIVFGLSGGMVF